MDRAAYLEDLLGTPYEKHSRHCWWLTGLVQRELFGRELPEATPELVDDTRARARALATHQARQAWREVDRPVDGAIALMGRVRGRETHCGVYLATAAGGRILHTDTPHGAVLDTPLELARIKGWRIGYFVPA